MQSRPHLATFTQADVTCSSSSVIHLLLLLLKPVYTLAALQVLLDQSTKANSPLKGHERTVQYLQRLGKDQQLAQAC